MRSVIFCLLWLLGLSVFAQNPWADKVLDHHFGLGQTLGQAADYFPQNVLGPLNPNVSSTTPASTPEEVLSLGRDGWLVVGFESPIIDGLGPDFTVFENAFEFPGGIFDEWLIVSVSQDGNTWFTFPYDSLTGAGFAGRTPTKGGNNLNYQNPAESGGDSFDLALLGLSEIKYVKLQDATRFQSPDRLSAEVDAVIALHQATLSSLSPNQSPKFQLSHGSLFVESAESGVFSVFDLASNLLGRFEVLAGVPLTHQLGDLPTAIYVFTFQGRQTFWSDKWLISQ